MLNLLTKTKPWMVASFLVATSVFGQEVPAQKPSPSIRNEQPCAKPCPKPDCKSKACPVPCQQPCPPTQMCPPAGPAACCPPWPVPVLNAAYNYPARIQTRCPWDISFDASFIYWQPLEDNLELGVVNTIPTVTEIAGSVRGNVVDMNFNYKPGFKAGMGAFFDYDNWDLHSEYTWFHTTNTKKAAVSTGALSSQQIFPMWGSPSGPGGLAIGGQGTYNSANAKWRMNMDIVDLDLGRWCYLGTKLTFRPSLGARAAFIRQRYKIVYDSITPFPNTTLFNETVVTAKTHSWGIGTKAAVDTNWLLGQGFRFFGCGEADILFTRYTKLSLAQSSIALPTATTAGFPTVLARQRNHNTVRTHLDLQMGFGWGTYWDCNNWYTDIQLGYEFQVFFDQNMFRHFNDNAMHVNSTMPNGDLFAQGLTAQFMLTF